MEKILEKLINIVGNEIVITDKEILEKYSEDKSTIYKKTPHIVVKPFNKKQIIEVVNFARENRLSITCWGQGTSVTGSCLVNSDTDILISFERLNKIIEIDTKNLIAVVEPGVITGDLKKQVLKYNLFYPPDPASYESSTIAGNIMTGAGGPSAVKYGTTKDYITGLEVIFSDGSYSTLGGKIVKNSSGYNLLDLFISSEGTLGIITKIYLKLLPKPLNTLTIYVTFENLFSLFKGVNELLLNSFFPICLEYIDDVALKYLNKKFNLPDKNANSSLLLEIEYDSDKQKSDKVMSIFNLLEKLSGFINLYPLENPAKEREIWNARRNIGEVFRENFKYIEKADIVVPRGETEDVIREIKLLGKKYELEVSCFGHAGDGNIHVNLLLKKQMKTDNFMKELYDIVKKYNGMPSGEHGIGIRKKEILKKFIDEKQYSLMKELKKVFDPFNIFNSGKILD